MVAGVTAAFVLLCSVYCACDAGAAGAAPACHVALQAAADADVPPCHGSGGAPAGGHERPSPLPLHHEGQECRHCQPAVTGVEAGKGSTELALSPTALPLIAVPAFILPPETPRHLSVALGDLPPPNQQSTLLGLHCALNT